MGKTYRRKDIHYSADDFQKPDRKEGYGKAVLHGDNSIKFSGLDSGVKQRQNEISRAERRKIKNRVMSGTEPMYDKTDKTVKCKADKFFQYN